MLIRKSHLSDFSGIYKLLIQTEPETDYDFEEMNFVFLKGLKASTQFYISAIDDGRIAGFCSISVKNSLLKVGYVAHIDELIVDVDNRRQGIGTLLMDTAFKLAEENNCKLLQMESGADKDGGAAFCARTGFIEKGVFFTRDVVTPEAI